MGYAEIFYFDYLKPLNIKEFTHRDILMHTTTNCPHKVLQSLKRLLNSLNYRLEEEKISNNGTKKYTIKDIEEWEKVLYFTIAFWMLLMN